MSVDLGPSYTFLTTMGPSIDGVTVKKNFVDIRDKRSFDSRQLHMHFSHNSIMLLLFTM